MNLALRSLIICKITHVSFLFFFSESFLSFITLFGIILLAAAAAVDVVLAVSHVAIIHRPLIDDADVVHVTQT